MQKAHRAEPCPVPGTGSVLARRRLDAASNVVLRNMVAGFCVFLGFRQIRPFTPAMFPLLCAFMVYNDIAVHEESGQSTLLGGPVTVLDRR